MRARNTKGWKVMPTCCATCPFVHDPELAARVLDRTLFRSSQICHHPTLHGKPETRLCRGQRDFQLQLLHHMGLIESPTDDAFERRSSEVLGT
jgi:hypothetical protein